ncbi:unnamed protein product, partial [marine sediment metagenome]
MKKPLLWLLVLVMSISLVAVFSSGSCRRVEEQSINILSPNGGEVWIEGNTYNITWDSSGIEKVDLV